MDPEMSEFQIYWEILVTWVSLFLRKKMQEGKQNPEDTATETSVKAYITG
jgi:hypothetical protein